jgi:uncharacterized protein (TIGR02453 family)
VAAVFPHSGVGKHEGAGFYFHLSPDELLIGGGLYLPVPEDLNAVRARIADDARSFLKIVRSPAFRKLFGELGGERLARVPRGFASEHPAAEYLRHKQFLAARIFPSDMATTPEFYRTLVETFRGMVPLVRFLNEPIVRSRRAKDRLKALHA